MDTSRAVEIVTAATGRATLDTGLEWIARDARLADGTDLHTLLRAVAALPNGAGSEAALRRLTRKLTASKFDSAAFLFDPADVERPEELEDALREIAAHSPAGRLANANDRALIAAQRANPRAVEALCYAASVAYNELQTRVDGLPSSPRRPWTPSQVRAAFKELDMVVRGTEKVDMQGAIGVRPIELLASGMVGDDAWLALERQLERGVPYGVLLAQRAVGGTWLARRNRFSNRLRPGLLARVCELLDQRRISYLRTTSHGGDISESAMQKLTRSDKQIGFVALDSCGRPAYALIFSVQRDSGSASKAARKLIGMTRDPSLTTAVVVAGPGWAPRSETAELAAVFEGRVFSDADLVRLVDDIADVSANPIATRGAIQT